MLNLTRRPGHPTTWLAAVLVSVSTATAFGEWPPVGPLPAAPAVAAPALNLRSVTAEPSGAGRWQCTFRLQAAPNATSASLAGSFNGWNLAATPMSRDGDGWSTTIELSGGRHLYKFVVDGDRWMPDPENPEQEDDGHDGKNSVLRLGRLARMERSVAAAGDGHFDRDGIEHDPASSTYFQSLPPNGVLIRLRTLAHDIEDAEVVVRGGATTPMVRVTEGSLLAYWEARVDAPAGAAAGGQQSIEYAIVVRDGGVRGLAVPPVTHTWSTAGAFATPDWARDAIWYQIMVDRFRNGDTANDPEPCHPWTSEWFKLQPWESAGGQTFYKYAVFNRLYGGDLAGLIEKLPYLKSLGVNAIYLNPIFEADSHHKYNATSYVHVDDDFGTRGDYAAAIAGEHPNDPKTWTWTESDKLFLKVIEEVHRHDMRIIIDGVFNHVGTNHPAFVDVKKNGRSSPYADWFEVKSWEPFEYVGWAGHDALPVFRKSPNGLASESCKQHIFDVTRRWMDPNGDGDPSDGIDGWRLDVPNEIAPPFWEEWRALVKSINPDAYITGEIWDRAEQWLDGRHFDAVMNYQFAHAAVYWGMYDRMKLKVSELDSRLAELRLAYPRVATYVMQNLVDSHDTDRLVSMGRNPDRKYDLENRVQDNGPRYDNSKPTPTHYRKARLVALLQMTYVGAPMIYYGDEAGMWGADDPTCRKPMLWKDLEPYEKPEENHVMVDHLEFYRAAIALRNAHPALRRGEFETLLIDDEQDVWAFARFDDNERLIVALNGSDSPRSVTVPLPDGWNGEWICRFGHEPAVNAAGGRLPLRVPAIGGVVYILKK
jgi:cyclomaltodextrinase